jgi:hypothetical protein
MGPSPGFKYGYHDETGKDGKKTLIVNIQLILSEHEVRWSNFPHCLPA